MHNPRYYSSKQRFGLVTSRSLVKFLGSPVEPVLFGRSRKRNSLTSEPSELVRERTRDPHDRWPEKNKSQFSGWKTSLYLDFPKSRSKRANVWHHLHFADLKSKIAVIEK